MDVGGPPAYADGSLYAVYGAACGLGLMCDGGAVESAFSVPQFESVSSWRQPVPASVSPARAKVIDELAASIAQLSPGRLRIAVDGYTAAGKTSLAHELAAALRRQGRPTLRASLDDFKHPWRDARERGYDRTSGQGYYRNAYDFTSTLELLLRPMAPRGSGVVTLCAHDPLTGVDHRLSTVEAPTGAVLIVDSVFAFRPEYNDHWDYRIWLDIDPGLSLVRGVKRDEAIEGHDEASRVHHDRYHVALSTYISEVDPIAKADVIIDNSDFAHPCIRPPGE